MKQEIEQNVQNRHCNSLHSGGKTMVKTQPSIQYQWAINEVLIKLLNRQFSTYRPLIHLKMTMFLLIFERTLHSFSVKKRKYCGRSSFGIFSSTNDLQTTGLASLQAIFWTSYFIFFKSQNCCFSSQTKQTQQETISFEIFNWAIVSNLALARLVINFKSTTTIFLW